MEFYEKLLIEKNKRKLNNVELGALIGMEGETFRMATKRKSLNKLQIKEIENFFENDKNYDNEFIGYYYPNVMAAAGLDKEMINDELQKVPINIPNWEKGIDFVNVYGDSMYPKFCSGEIIGIKEVELQYVNFGHAYVIVFKDGQVFLKYIKKGSDNLNWVLDSENPKYEPQEYKINQIKKVFIIKGVITKTTM
jgi:phage repressor protein C with HTH and peptisase S24 domain